MRPRPFAGLSGWLLARRIVAPALFVAALFVSVFTYDAPPVPTLEDLALEEVTLDGAALGTTWSVRVVGATPDTTHQRDIGIAVTTALEEVDALMSTWRDDSELSAFNRHTATTPFVVSPPTLAVMLRSETIWQQTGGAFDVTVYPLVRAWGFGGATTDTPPDADTVSAILERVGQQHLTLDQVALTVTKDHPEVTVDLSAIAKGYAVDRVSRAVTELGYRHHMVEVGGEVRAHGWNRYKRPWRIAVERPDSEDRAVEKVVELSGLSMATSGDYRNFREADGRRWSHTVDPRSGQARLHALASATVLHRECALADAYATALMVLGPQEAMLLAERLDLAALLLVRTADGGFEHRPSPAFVRHQAEARDLPHGPDAPAPAG